MSSLDPLHDLGVLGPAVGHLPAGEDLPAQHPVRPHVALAGEPREVQYLGGEVKLQFGNFTSSPYLRRTPLDRKLCPTIAGVLIVNDVSCKTKVSNFYHVLVSNKTISSCQISMDVVVLLKICHASTHLIQKMFMCKHIIVYVNM